jgi:hypothetical protein
MNKIEHLFLRNLNPNKDGVAPPLWAKCEGEAHTPKNSELEFKGQNTSHWGVLVVIEKVLKCRCPKWPHMSHLDICSPSYGQKKGQESNWQFDSWPLKVGNRPFLDVYRRSATWHWKALEEIYNFGLDLTPIGGWSQEIWALKVPGIQPRTVLGLLLGSPGKKNHLDVASAESCREYYMGEGGGFPSSPGRGESNVSKCPWLVPTPKSVPECELTLLWLVLDADSSEIILVPLPSLIPGLLACPSTPF